MFLFIQIGCFYILTSFALINGQLGYTYRYNLQYKYAFHILSFGIALHLVATRSKDTFSKTTITLKFEFQFSFCIQHTCTSIIEELSSSRFQYCSCSLQIKYNNIYNQHFNHWYPRRGPCLNQLKWKTITSFVDKVTDW